MDQFKAPLSFKSAVECCTCGCNCAFTTSSPLKTRIGSVKRKYDEFKENTQFQLASLDNSDVVRVKIENECNALREMVSNQQTIIQELSIELDEERNASSSAANETMSMIRMLQREKAEVQMEARNFKRFSEDKMNHNAEEILALEDLLYKREQALHSLTWEVQAYKHRMMSFGLKEAEAEGLHDDDDDQNQISGEVDLQVCIYPPLKCKLNDLQSIENHEDVVDIDTYPFDETPCGQDHLKSIEYRINQLERTPDGVSNPSDASDREDDMSDRVYAIDSIQHGASYNNARESANPETCEKYVSAARRSLNEVDVGDTDVKKLYLRLEALEADRESLKQTIISMQTDKSQLVFLREIAQQLCKDMSMERRMPVKKHSAVGNSSFMTVFKWLLSISLWRKKARQSKHTFGMSADCVGLLCILEERPRTRLWRCVNCTQV